MARVVVTGGFGFVGSHVVERLLRQGDDVTVLDTAACPPDLTAAQGRLRHVVGDVRDEAALARAVTDGTDTVYHLAATVGVDRYLDRPLEVLEVNVQGTYHVLRRATRVGAYVVLASTSEVFGRNLQTPWAEDSDRVLGSTAIARWSYSSSKATAEHLAFAFMQQEDLRASIVRYFNVYGPRQRPAYVVSRTVHRLLRGLPPLVYDGGTQTRCFTYVADAAEATLLVRQHPAARGEAFNIGSERETTVAEVVRLACEIAQPDGTLVPLHVNTHEAIGASYQDIPRRVPDTAKAHAILGHRCTTSLEDGLRRTIAWARTSSWTRQRLDGTAVGELHEVESLH